MSVEATIAVLESLVPEGAGSWDDECEADLARLEAASGRKVPPLLERIFRLQGHHALMGPMHRSSLFEVQPAGHLLPPVFDHVRYALGDQAGTLEDFGGRLRDEVGWPVMAFGVQIGDPAYWLVVGDDEDPPVMLLVDIGRPHSLVATSLSSFVAGLILPDALKPRLGTVGSDLDDLDVEFVNDPAHRVEIEVSDTSCYDSDELVAVFDEVLDSMMTKVLTQRSSPTESTPFDIRNSLTGPAFPLRHNVELRDPVYGVHAAGFQNRMRPIVGLCVATALSLVEGSPIDDRINAFGHGRGARIHGTDAATVLGSWRVDGTIDDLGLQVRDTIGPRVLNDIRPSRG